ncbi:MAG: XrtA/PEP-CTERM system-associated ATPase [Geobacteraceae bacterium]
MYESFFELRIKPFELLPDPKFIYLSKSHKKALTYLDYGIRERAGFILLTGEVGSGKTTLIRNLLDKHYEQIVLSKIFNTRATSEQLLAMINDDFGLSTHGKDKVSLIRDLNNFLVDQYALGNHPILIIDEAQNLAPDLLEEVRMLSNLETSDSKLLQIVLVGQPELRTILSTPELRQLRQRIGISCHLQALSREETEHYIMHRMEVAGNPSAVDFPVGSLDIVYSYSKGIPRLINTICDFLMLSAFAEETKNISIEMVREVVGDLDFDNNFWATSVSENMAKRHADDTYRNDDDSGLLPKDVRTLLLDISRRLDSMEKDVAALANHPAPALTEFNDRFKEIQDAVNSNVAKTDSQVSCLNRSLEEIKVDVAKGCIPVMRNNSTSREFIRKLFGSDYLSKLK